MHRLNRAEYDNTVHDLLGTNQKPSEDFPIDDRGNGFDNMADVLTLSPLHLSTYSTAAKALVSEALGNATQRAALLTCDLSQGDTCTRQVLKGFANRAWRRPIADAELDRLVAVTNVAKTNGDSAEVGLGLALRAVLLSPHFIFRVELDADPLSPTPHALTGYELASRLSYFLWSSMPDAALFAAAESGALANAATLKEQVVRLMADPRARSLVDNFAGQWLHLRAVDSLEPDTALFPNVDAPLLSAMKSEAELVFRDIAFAGTPAVDLLTANYTYLNDRLASHYGLAAVGSTELKRVELMGNTQRGGLLTQGGFLTLTSHVNRTSPVVRGQWLMQSLLGAKIPSPPPGAEADLVLLGPDGVVEETLVAGESVYRRDDR